MDSLDKTQINIQKNTLKKIIKDNVEYLTIDDENGGYLEYPDIKDSIEQLKESFGRMSIDHEEGQETLFVEVFEVLSLINDINDDCKYFDLNLINFSKMEKDLEIIMKIQNELKNEENNTNDNLLMKLEIINDLISLKKEESKSFFKVIKEIKEEGRMLTTNNKDLELFSSEVKIYLVNEKILNKKKYSMKKLMKVISEIGEKIDNGLYIAAEKIL